MYHSSKDVDGKNWLPFGQFVDKNGVSYGYFDAPKLQTCSNIYPYDQSKSRHNTHQAYMDAWGLGMWELAKSASWLEPKDREVLVELLKGYLDFAHRSYMLKSESDSCYWRTDAFSPLAPTAIPEPNWAFLGLDVIHAACALNVLGGDTKPWHQSLKKFAVYYMRERPKHSDVNLVEYTDLRAMDLADFLEKVCQDNTLSKWLKREIPCLYAKRQLKVAVVTDGHCLKYSPLPVMELFIRYEPNRFRTMWRELLRDHVTPRGIFQEGEFPDINESEHEGILDISIAGWHAGVLSDSEFRQAVEKLFLMWGSPRSSLSAEDWVMGGSARSRQRRGWAAIPYPGYPENVRPEGYYGGMPQVFTQTRGSGCPSGLFDNFNSIEYFNVNVFIQYTSPGAHHTERLRFGQMASFDIFDTHDASKQKFIEKNGKKIMEVECVTPDVPSGTPCAGIVKVTEMYCHGYTLNTPTGYEVVSVLHDGDEAPFVVSPIYGYDDPPTSDITHPLGSIDSVKLCFLLRAGKAGRVEKVRVVFDKVF